MERVNRVAGLGCGTPERDCLAEMLHPDDSADCDGSLHAVALVSGEVADEGQRARPVERHDRGLRRPGRDHDLGRARRMEELRPGPVDGVDGVVA